MERNPRPEHDRTARKVLARTPGRRAALAVLAVVAAGQGCYTYQQTELPALTPGSEIRVELEDRHADNMPAGTSAALMGPRRLEGRFARLTEDSLVVSVWIGEAYAGTPFAATYQDVLLARNQIATVEDRQLNKGRTLLTSLAGTALIAYIIDSIGLVQFFGSGGDGGTPFPPEDFVR